MSLCMYLLSPMDHRSSSNIRESRKILHLYNVRLVKDMLVQHIVVINIGVYIKGIKEILTRQPEGGNKGEG